MATAHLTQMESRLSAGRDLDLTGLRTQRCLEELGSSGLVKMCGGENAQHVDEEGMEK